MACRLRLGTYEVGAYCAVQETLLPEEPEEWHRAQIIRVDGDGILWVRLIDFGLCMSLKVTFTLNKP